MKFGKSLRAFLKSMGSVLEIHPSTSAAMAAKVKDRMTRSDADILAGDWNAIGGDFRVVGDDIRKATTKIIKDKGLNL